MARHKKKRKLKLSRIFLVLVVLAVIGFLVDLFVKIPVRGYYISGNTYYTDWQILEKTKLDRYPSFALTNSFMVSQRVKNDDLIKKIKIKKTFTGMFNVIVEENKILFYDANKKKSILENGKESSIYIESSPVLVNSIDDKKVYDRLITKIPSLNDNIMKNISEIKYDPNDIDKERFLLSMNDGNYVYITLSKISNINSYLEISNTLGDKNGILYLDYGNYFVPKE